MLLGLWKPQSIPELVSAGFCYPTLISSHHSYPRVAVFQKLRSLAQSKAKPKQSLSLYHNCFSLKKGSIYTSPSFFFPLSPKFQVNLIE